ncbi:MAG: IucA/IucC family siderophore biosynthesis protein [Thermoleophilia bacterium]
MSAAAWERANRELVAKLLTELAFEDLIDPPGRDLPDGGRELTLTLGPLTLTYRAAPRAMGWWRVDPASVRAEADGVGVPLPDAAEIVAIGAPLLGADAATTAGLVHEIQMTARSDAGQIERGRPAAALLDLDPLLVEGEMRGHPWIVASKGRVGFGADDLRAYAPEAQRPVPVRWAAVAAGRADWRGLPGLDNARVVREQVGEAGWAELRDRAVAAGVDPDAAVVMPVHPWQWSNRIATLHAGEIARGEIADLGELPLRYVAGQSIRTLSDLDHPRRRYMKLSLSILNTSVYRGLPRARTLAAPALTAWFTGLVDRDPFLAAGGLVLLGEVASASVAHRAFEAVPGVPYQHTEMLGAIWREPVAPRLRPGERAVTMAALIHRDPDGVGYVEPLIERAGVTVDEWVTALHRAVLPPLLHVLYRFGAAFSPHAQNCMVVLRGDLPTGLVVKDFVDDANISSDPIPELADLPHEVRAALGDGVESMVLSQWIQAGLLVCVYRYLSEILLERLGYPERAFWDAAERVVAAYQDETAPELAARFALFDFEAPAFVKLCLNRVRILGRGYADGAERPVAAAVGWIDNPLAPAEEAAWDR